MSSKVLAAVIVVFATIAWMGLAAGGGAHSPVASVPQGPAARGAAGSTTLGAGTPAAREVPPAVSAATPSRASIVARLPSSLAQVPWLESALHTGPTLRPLSSLPNLNLLEQTAASGPLPVYPPYVAQPAPLGLADFGLGATDYAYNTSHFLGELTLFAPPNATDPAAGGVTEPGAAHLGYVGSMNEFGVQLNTVVTNISFPQSNTGEFWTQNVVDWNASGIHFVDDTFNFSSGLPLIQPGTIYSGCHNSTTGVDQILSVYGGVFQCVGGTVPVSPASYPVTLQLYNNASVNAQDRDQVAYGYRLVEAGTGKVFTGVSDVVVFNYPAAPWTPPPNPPGFSVDGFARSPFAGILRDAELVVVGDIGGDNAVFRSLNGTLNLEFSNLSSGGWQNVPSAYNFGADTGETSTGIADYWEPNETLVLHQGPAMLYGLWHAVPSVSVASGDLHLAGTITPSYGFVFVSNSAPPANPNTPGQWSNLSWLPTDDLGQFDTYLPPLGSPWTTQYYVQAFAAGSAETNGTPVAASTTDYSLDLPLAPGTDNAPLYAFSNAQAAGLALNVTGSASAPYVFSDLTLHVNLSFNHLNDFGYASFELALFQGVTDPVHVNNVTAGPNWIDGASDYLEDDNAAGLLTPAYQPFPVDPRLTSQINLFYGVGDLVTNESLYVWGELLLWHDSGATVAGYSSEDGSGGVYVGASNGTTVRDGNVVGGLGALDVDSTNTTVEDLNVSQDGLGVETYSSRNATFSTIQYAPGGSSALGGGAVVGGLDDAVLEGWSPYYNVPGVSGAKISGVVGYGSALGVYLMDSADVSISRVNFSYLPNSPSYGGAVVLVGTNHSSVEASVVVGYTIGLDLDGTDRTNVSGVDLSDNGVGAEIWGGTSDSTITRSVFFQNAGDGVDITHGTGNLVYDNSFILNDGSAFVFSPTHIQAYTAPDNSFNLSSVGNCWADWNSTTAGVLNPYAISEGVADEHPIACPGPGTYRVAFRESGLLPAGEPWLVGFDGFAMVSGGSAGTPTVTTVAFPVPNGSYDFLVVGPSGWRASAPSGSVVVAGANVTEAESFVPGSTHTLTFGETGLRKRTGWCLTLAGAYGTCTATTKLTFENLTPATYSFALGQVGGLVSLVKVGKAWVPETSGTIALTGSLKVSVGYGYAVIFTESGLASGQGWSVKVGSLTESETAQNLSINGRNITFYLPNGTDSYKVLRVPGYQVLRPTGQVRVKGEGLDVHVQFENA